ncbi:hypothetical protein RRG08_050455 [Elysia crispata]|uniref:Uncharacterized protein n=1 Tax=Elysia crispata TaxID=231223 RepID=A0AAE1DHZ2_9GAST|nr:hypothetical protein RRG08_050455 [Elysia crispata]
MIQSFLRPRRGIDLAKFCLELNSVTLLVENCPPCKEKTFHRAVTKAEDRDKTSHVLIDYLESTASGWLECPGTAHTVPKQCTGIAETVHRQCRNSAQAVPKQCTGSAQTVHRQCPNSAQAVPLE